MIGRSTILVGLAVVLACGSDPGPSGDDAASGASGSGSDSGSGTGDGASSGGGVGSGGGTGGGSTTGGSNADSGDSAGSGGSSSGGVWMDVKNACIATCEHLHECGLEQDIPQCSAPCGSVVTLVMGCEEQYIAEQQCALALSCDDVMAWDAASGPDYPCAAEDDALSQCTSG